MRRFLKLHFNFEDDLRRAAVKAEEAGNGASAGTLLWYADELKHYKPEKRYFCNGGRNSLSGLRVWQKNTLQIAAQYDRCIFTRQEIEHLAERLIEFSKTQKNVTEEVRGPKFEDEDKYGISPGITIGSNCYINFIPVKGDYEY